MSNATYKKKVFNLGLMVSGRWNLSWWEYGSREACMVLEKELRAYTDPQTRWEERASGERALTGNPSVHPVHTS